MANKMLIDATHSEETRVVVLRGNRVEEFDFESAHRKQLRGNIYLAKVTRVEPSLQAAFVEYGGNRHGFLAFSEIHPDYYQIPIADRRALIDEEQRAQRAADEEVERRPRRHRAKGRPAAAQRHDEVVHSELTEAPAGDSAVEALQPVGAIDSIDSDEQSDSLPTAPAESDAGEGPAAQQPQESPTVVAPFPTAAAPGDAEPGEPYPSTAAATAEALSAIGATAPEGTTDEVGETAVAAGDQANGARESGEEGNDPDGDENDENDESDENGEEIVESVGGADALEEVPDRALRYRREYKIQEVIKRRQVILVQVVKEERGSKGAAVTTYLSLAGRYCVLMPNTARGGGISRKITNGEDRARLKEIAQELEVPDGMGVILRTAGASRTKAEIKRDFEYLLRLWETVRNLTLNSTAPKLVYEEGSLVKRSIRDLYSKDIDEIIVAGVEASQEAKDFMRMLMPSHAKNVKLYNDAQPLLSRYGVEHQLDAMFSPVVQLRSGGYVVLNQAEALVAIDVNSGRATREHHIEDTALKTNLEAADEIARQLRLRDLAGLIVIDFIDMDEKRNNRAVERRLKECLKQDRARIQVGRISHFGLLEMSRQRIRASVLESSTEKCPYCGGGGRVRSVSSLALQVLRALEEQLMKGATHNLIARTRPDVALYVLNQKRGHLRGLEERFDITVTIAADEALAAQQEFAIDRGEQMHTLETARALSAREQPVAAPLEEEDDLQESGAAEGEEVDDQAEDTPEAAGAEREVATRRPRRRRRRGRGADEAAGEGPAHPQSLAPAILADAAGEIPADAETESANDDEFTAPPQPHERDERGEHRRRRRGRRGGRRNRPERERDGESAPETYTGAPRAPDDEYAPEEAEARAQTESERTPAGADLDGPRPAAAPTAAQPAIFEATPEQPIAGPKPPRHRSTVREPAPISGSGGEETPQAHPQPVNPAPELVISEVDEVATSERPRRIGWWSRRSADG